MCRGSATRQVSLGCGEAQTLASFSLLFSLLPPPHSKLGAAELDRAALTHRQVAKVQHTGNLLNNRGFPIK